MTHDREALPPGLPRDEAGPVFREPWEAQAFALAVQLHEAGHFTWPEWTAALSQAIADAQTAGDPDLGGSYYRHWLAALERLLSEKGVVDEGSLTRRHAAWERAYRETPHGQPVTLSPDTDRA